MRTVQVKLKGLLHLLGLLLAAISLSRQKCCEVLAEGFGMKFHGSEIK